MMHIQYVLSLRTFEACKLCMCVLIKIIIGDTAVSCHSSDAECTGVSYNNILAILSQANLHQIRVVTLRLSSSTYIHVFEIM